MARPPRSAADETWTALLDQLAQAWDRGEPFPIDAHVAQATPGDAVDLIYQEFCLAEAAGQRPDPATVLQRFPNHAEALRRLFDLHDALSVASLQRLVEPEANLPRAGDDLGPYRLLREMGRGAFARVFLAEQVDLGDRLVIVKVSTRPSSEPTLLGRARHPHIVEVLRHIDDPASGLHLVCLPFLGGATLGSVLDAWRLAEGGGAHRRPQSGSDLLTALDRVSAPEYPTTDRPRPARAELARLSYPKALAWVIARLAEALDHAWRRGVTHGDLKPSNILLTADGVPMLFDFNLASDRRGVDEGADLGGTLAYMAPERLDALANPAGSATPSRLAEPQPGRLRAPERHRADLYALGLILAETLTGEPPATPDRRSEVVSVFAAELVAHRLDPGYLRSVCRSRRIPAALRSILARCLAPDPSDRYAHAGELAEDLDRWRMGRPLVFAPEPRRTVWARRLRRVRYPLGAIGLVASVAALVGAGAWSVLEGTQRDQSVNKWDYILDRTEGVFPSKEQSDRARRSGEDQADQANRHLAHYDVLADPHWRDRPDVRSLPIRERREVEGWVLEQVLRRAMAYAARPNSPGDWRRALSVIETEAERAPYAALLQQRAILRERFPDQGGHPVRSAWVGPVVAPEPWLDAYLLGVQAEPLQARAALRFYQEALAAQPDFFWAHYRSAVTAWYLGDHRVTIESLRVCVARRPENASLGDDLAQAILDLTRLLPPGPLPADLGEAQAQNQHALALDPDHVSATRTQAMLHQILGQTETTRNNLSRFRILTGAREPAASRMLESQLKRFQVSHQRTNSAAGLDELALRQVLATEPTNWRARTELANSLVRLNRLDEASQIYQGLFTDHPNDLYARYQYAFCLLYLEQPAALEEFLALANHPHLEEFLQMHIASFRIFTTAAHLLLQKGRLDEAETLIQRGWAAVAANPACRPEVFAIRSPGEAMFPEAELHFRAAQIDAKATATDPTRLPRAIEHLRAAFAVDPMFRETWFPRDPNFRPYAALILHQIDTPSATP